MLPRRNILLCLALAAALLCPGPAAAQTTDLHPRISGYETSALTLEWDTTAFPVVAAISTNAGFTTVVASGSLIGNTTTYTNLNTDTTYYFRVKIKSESEAAYSQISISTVTPNAPAAPYFILSELPTASSYTAVAKLGWSTAGNPDWTNYELQYADNPGFAGANIRTYQLPPVSVVSVGGLNANTTYYFRVRARAFRGAATAYTSPDISTATPALGLSGLGESHTQTSATIVWTPVLSGIQAMNSEGYRILYSLSADMSAPFTPWTTAAPATASALLTPLATNTAYYYRAGALNWNGTANLSDTRPFTTLGAPLTGFQRVPGAGWTAWTARLGWTALPAAFAAGYRLEASTSNFSGGTVLSSSTDNVLLNALTVSALDSNTTYYFRAASLNTASPDPDPNYTASVTSVTLAPPIPAILTNTVPEPLRITVSFTPNPPAPPSISCEGYRLEASTKPFSSDGVIRSSATADNQADQLVILGLVPNVNYYLRLATLNWQGTPNYTDLITVKTPLPGSFSDAALTGVWRSSATVTFDPGDVDPDGYVMETSTQSFFETILKSSSSVDYPVSALAISGLPENTYFYCRVGALFNGGTVYLNTDPPTGYTLPLPLTNVTTNGGVFPSSVTVSWTPLADTSQATRADHYLLQAAANAAFNPVLFFSSTPFISDPSLTIDGLTPNTSYYFRAATLNLEGGVSYVATPATSTMASPPTKKTPDIAETAMTINWLANLNPADTYYLTELSLAPGFSAILKSSTGTAVSQTFTGLTPNIYYWARVTAINRLNRKTPAVDFSSAATGAELPGVPSSYVLGVASLAVQWASGGNPNSTYYRAAISSSSFFSGLVLSSDTLSLSATFYPLLSNTSYYLRVSALNPDWVPTAPANGVLPGLTRPATPYILTPEETFTDFLTDGFIVNWGSNNNSDITVYRVRVATEPGFSVISSTIYATGTSCRFSDLPMDTTYWVRIQAASHNGSFSLAVDTGTAKTLFYTQNNAVALNDNTISLDTSYGTISVYLPKGSIGGSTIIDLRTLSSFEPPVSPVAVLRPTNIGLAITHFPLTLVLNAITITLPYKPADLPGWADRSKLILALFDEVNRVWIPLPSVSESLYDPVLQKTVYRVRAQTWHLSTFQLMEASSEAGLSGVRVYPNPYRPNSVAGVMHFTNMTANAKVKIYTFVGELVRSINADTNGMAAWDGLNSSGQKAVSGIYIAFIQSSDKNKTRTLKIALER